jgi:AraC family transcriptional regulator
MLDDTMYGCRRSMSIPGFTLREILLQRTTAIPEHGHDLAYLGIVFGGGIVDEAAGDRYELSAGDVIFRPPGSRHRNVIAGGTSVGLVVELEPEVMSSFRPLYGNQLRSIVMPSGRMEGLPQRLAAELRRRDAARDFIIRGLLIQLLALGARRAHDGVKWPETPWLRDAQAYINANLGKALSLDDVAEAAGVSPLTLSRNFRLRLGMPLRDYVREMRIAQATSALVETTRSIGDIAAACGFYDQAQFARAFRGLTGMTAAEYRRLYRTAAVYENER